MHRPPLFILLAFVLLSLAACGSDEAYCDFAELPRSGWAYGDTIAFTPTAMPDTLSRGRLVVVVRHTNAYPYSNLWLEVAHTAADGIHTRRDTINCQLADPYGRWRGKGFGTSYQATDTLPLPVVLRQGQPIAIRHIMRVDTLTEIEHLGIILLEPNSTHSR